MGWGSASSLVSKIISSTQQHVRDAEVRQRLYSDYIKAFTDADWDTVEECLEEDPAFDAAVRELYPHRFTEDDE